MGTWARTGPVAVAAMACPVAIVPHLITVAEREAHGREVRVGADPGRPA